MYFETGQGSEFKKFTGNTTGIDMTTAEALCYGLARRYDPFVHGEQRDRLHRPRNAYLDNFRDEIISESPGPFHGQTPGGSDGHGALLHDDASPETTLEGRSQIATRSS